VGVQREAHHGQGDARRERTGTLVGSRAPPAADCKHGAGYPQQQAKHSGLAQHFQHDLMRMRGTLPALWIDEPIAG